MPNMRLLSFCILLSLSLSTQATPPEVILIRSNGDSVGLYNKFEIGFNIKAQFVNPFDPAQIDIAGTFPAPSGKQWVIHGFYDNSRFTLWKIRFAADETG